MLVVVYQLSSMLYYQFVKSAKVNTYFLLQLCYNLDFVSVRYDFILVKFTQHNDCIQHTVLVGLSY